MPRPNLQIPQIATDGLRKATMVLADEVGHVQAFMLFGCCLDAVWMQFYS